MSTPPLPLPTERCGQRLAELRASVAADATNGGLSGQVLRLMLRLLEFLLAILAGLREKALAEAAHGAPVARDGERADRDGGEGCAVDAPRVRRLRSARDARSEATVCDEATRFVIRHTMGRARRTDDGMRPAACAGPMHAMRVRRDVWRVLSRDFKKLAICLGVFACLHCFGFVIICKTRLKSEGRNHAFPPSRE